MKVLFEVVILLWLQVYICVFGWLGKTLTFFWFYFPKLQSRSPLF